MLRKKVQQHKHTLQEFDFYIFRFLINAYANSISDLKNPFPEREMFLN